MTSDQNYTCILWQFETSHSISLFGLARFWFITIQHAVAVAAVTAAVAVATAAVWFRQCFLRYAQSDSKSSSDDGSSAWKKFYTQLTYSKMFIVLLFASRWNQLTNLLSLIKASHKCILYTRHSILSTNCCITENIRLMNAGIQTLVRQLGY